MSEIGTIYGGQENDKSRNELVKIPRCIPRDIATMLVVRNIKLS